MPRALWLLPLLAVGLSGAVAAVAQDTSASRETTLAAERSAWEGVYSAAQAARGESTFRRGCAACHALAEYTGGTFLGTWTGRRAWDLFKTIRTSMPLDDPGSLPSQEYLDLVAYLFQRLGFPAGTSELAADSASLGQIRIGPKPP